MTADLDELAAIARKRGLKLVRSRVRTPGKRRFGNVGCSTPAATLLGIGDKFPKGKPDAAEAYLRSLDETAWKKSLRRKRT